MNIRKFNCSQQELYAVCTHAWDTCNKHIDRFTAFKPKYDKAFIEARKAAIIRAERLDDFHQRSSLREQRREELREQADLCLVLWKKLRTYIQEIWPKPQSGIFLKNAGQVYYREACMHKWDAYHSMMGNAESFVAEHSTQLQANGVMEAGFPAQLSAQTSAFLKAYSEFLGSFTEAGMGAAEKVTANNTLYTDMMAMFTDARIIFRKEPELQKLFVFESVVQLVAGHGTAGIKGLVGDSKHAYLSMEGTVLQVLETGDDIIADDEGRYRFSHMAAGNYTLHVQAAGYKPRTISNVIVQPGAYTMLNIVMEKEAIVA